MRNQFSGWTLRMTLLIVLLPGLDAPAAGQRDRTWLDHVGNFHSDAVHVVVERYTEMKTAIASAACGCGAFFATPIPCGRAATAGTEASLRLVATEIPITSLTIRRVDYNPDESHGQRRFQRFHL